MRPFLHLLPLLLLATLPAPGSAAPDPVEIAVVVNTANPLNGLTREELGRMLRQEKQFWADNTAIELHLPGPGLAGRALLRAECAADSEAELKKLWLGKIFRGQTKRAPAQHEKAEDLAARVGEQAKALGLVPAAGVPGNLKTLAIDGKKPGEPGYTLVETAAAP